MTPHELWGIAKAKQATMTCRVLLSEAEAVERDLVMSAWMNKHRPKVGDYLVRTRRHSDHNEVSRHRIEKILGWAILCKEGSITPWYNNYGADTFTVEPIPLQSD